MPIKIDFGRVQTTGSTKTLLDPRKIFTVLPRDPRFKRPLDEQADVLDDWFERRDRRDTTVKMNTGAGKTLVGLLILQSSLNEAVGPAVYITPDNHLASQVLREAKDLGISATDDDRDPGFLSGKSILVIVVHKLFNGLSRFGVNSVKVPIGTCVIDDVHSCLATVARQFSISVDATSAVYKGIFKLFKSDLDNQSPLATVQIGQHDPSFYLTVPFWAWKRNLAAVAKLLYENREDENLLFNWPLIKDSLQLCQCVIGGSKLEIAPRCIPVDALPSFNSAKRRVYMTATLADDGVLISRLNADPAAVQEPIRPRGVGDIGERLILIPQEINPKITDEDIRLIVVDVARQYNVTVVVPSSKRLPFWERFAAQILDKDNIEAGVERLRTGQHIGLTVLLNKYDGVDLPGDACRLLVLDGLPDVYGLVERAESSALEGTEIQLIRQVQKVEQGMGRGVRSSEDHCAVVLMGRALVGRLHLPAARVKFTGATRAQLELSENVSAQLKGQSAEGIREVLDLSLRRDPEWIAASRAALVEAEEEKGGFVSPTVISIRQAFDEAKSGLWSTAAATAQAAVGPIQEKSAKGYMLLQVAEFLEHVNPSQAQEVLMAAATLNNRTTKPLVGVAYSRLSGATADQATQIAEFLSQFSSATDLSIWGNALIDELIWDEDRTKHFETAIETLGNVLGFGSQRPEADTGKGPDNLWAVGDQRYFVIECKSGSRSVEIAKSDCDQLTGATKWFETKYGPGDRPTPIIIHPKHIFDNHSSPHPETRIMDDEHLAELKNSLRTFLTALGASNSYRQVQAIGPLLVQLNFNAGAFINRYSVRFKIARK
jgi:hypothetical protein